MERFSYIPQEMRPSYADRDGKVWRPMMPFDVEGLAGRFPLVGLVDSGATETLLPMDVRDHIDPAHREGEVGTLEGADGSEFGVWYGTVNLIVKLGRQRYRWGAVVGFTDAREEAVLGDAGFMRYFHVAFDRPHRLFTVRPAVRLPAAISIPR